MKIEKLNENQVKITLTQDDLLSHQLKVSELAYGSEKAKALFKEMMKQASREVGFQLEENMPIMVEAIPEKGNALVLIITKVENPEEIDTRFAKMSPSPLAAKIEQSAKQEGADDIIDLFKRLHDVKPGRAQKPQEAQTTPEKEKKTTDKTSEKNPRKQINLIRLYHFDTIDEVINAAHALGNFYKGQNTLYKSHKDGTYLLVLHQSAHTPEEFNKVCNILSEYAVGAPYTRASEAHLEEHETAVLKNEALQQLETF